MSLKNYGKSTIPLNSEYCINGCDEGSIARENPVKMNKKAEMNKKAHWVWRGVSEPHKDKF